MDPRRFDVLIRSLGHATSRRGALALVLAGLLAPLRPNGAEGARDPHRKRGGTGMRKSKEKANDRGGRARSRERGDDNDGHKDRLRDKGGRRSDGTGASRGKTGDRRRTTARPARAEAVCYTGKTCTPGPGKNLSTCDFAASSTLKGKNLKGANLGGTSLARADASGANLQGANLSMACLVDANLRGAQINASTNTADAIFCRTTMPDGSTNTSGCGKGTTCCPACDTAHPCPNGQTCCGGRCRAGDCCTDGQCADPAEPMCLNNTCSPCATNRQCGNGKVCCHGTCRTGDCCAAGDCADRSCQTRSCQNSRCIYTPANGAACDDGDPCTVNDACRNGSCSGTAKDCSGQTDVCNTGVCRGSDGACVPRPKDDGTPCGNGGACQGGVCEETCLALRAVCQSGDNACCQELPTRCDELPAFCYAAGAPQDDRCCRAVGGTCSGACDCCGPRGCEQNACCSFAGGDCQTAANCCTDINQQACVNGRCCVLEGEICEGPNECCAGVCSDDGLCQGCLALQQSCEPETNQCCQEGGLTRCDEIAFGSEPTCCRPTGGACSENGDCCRGGTCCNGICCAAEQSCVGGTTCASCQFVSGSYCDGQFGSPNGCCPGNGTCRNTIRTEPGRRRCCVPDGTPCFPSQGLSVIACCGGYCDAATETCSSTCTPAGGLCTVDFGCCSDECDGTSAETPIGRCRA